MSEELKPCPFCGCTDVYSDTDTCRIFGERTGHNYAVACSNCEAVAIGSETLEEAIAAWNTRADLLPVVKPLVWKKHTFLWVSTNGHYRIELDRPRYLTFFTTLEGAKLSLVCGDAETPDAAIVAANKHNADRIRASLDMIDPAALVAGAYEAAAQLVLRQVDGLMKEGLAQDIRALTLANAQAALDAAIAKAVNKKLDEVVKLPFATDMCEGWCETADEQGHHGDCVACEMTRAILAMKEPE